MADRTELKRLATRIVEVQTSQDVPISKLFDDFEAAACPETILALIAENDRIKARLCVCRDCGGQGEVSSGHSSYQGHNQPPEPDMDVCGTCGGDGVLGPLEDFESLAAERDQLKAENDQLKNQEIELKAENEALVSALNDILRVTPMGVEAFGIAALVLGELSGVAMGKGEQS